MVGCLSDSVAESPAVPALLRTYDSSWSSILVQDQIALQYGTSVVLDGQRSLLAMLWRGMVVDVARGAFAVT